MKQHFKLIIALVFGLIIVTSPLLVLAADENIIINPEQIINGNYVKVGNNIEIKGAVNGDVIVGGNAIIISGPIAGDVIAVGNSIKINGPVLGSIRLAGNTVEVANTIDHNAWIVANSVVFTKDAKIGWETNVSASSIDMQSVAVGNVWLAGTNINIGSVSEKNIEATVNTDGKINLTNQANIKGNLIFHAAKDSQLSKQDGSQIAGSTERKDLKNPKPDAWDKFLGPVGIFLNIVSLFCLLIVGLVLITIFPKVVLKTKEVMIKQPKDSILRGLVWTIVLPFIILFLMITIIGFPLALILIPIFLIMLYLAKVIAGFTIGLYVFDYLNKEKKYKGNLIWPMVAGLAILVFITSLPWLGFIIKAILVWWAFGALISSHKGLVNELK